MRWGPPPLLSVTTPCIFLGLTLILLSGGQEQSLTLGPETNSYNLVGLEPATKYQVWLSILGQTGEGPPRKVTAYTGEPPKALTSLWCALPPH